MPKKESKVFICIYKVVSIYRSGQHGQLPYSSGDMCEKMLFLINLDPQHDNTEENLDPRISDMVRRMRRETK